VKPADLPSNAEIRDEVQALARSMKAERTDALLEMRLAGARHDAEAGEVSAAADWERDDGHIRQGSDIDLHVFCDSAEAVAHLLEAEGLVCDIERKRCAKTMRSGRYAYSCHRSVWV